MMAEREADYRAGLFLPQTEFAMRARLPEREPEMIARWENMNLWKRLRKASEGGTKYILHDGPPYANGPIHIGTALNKILKDLVNRTRQMDGFDAHYVPGWDCHGLPIEWRIEESYRKKGKRREDIPIDRFRRECREFADKWIGVQMEDFQRIFVLGDWERRYLTMDFSAEAQIVREIGCFLLDGSLYRGLKPVMWSPVERTALAEAEVEYRDIESTAVFVRFPVASTSLDAVAGTDVTIWTTTPWTLPGNRAIAFGAEIDYVVLEVTGIEDGASATPGDRLVLAAKRADAVQRAVGISSWEERARFPGAELASTVCCHPLAAKGYDFEVPLLAGDFVGTDQGTGLVHVAPAHGDDDYLLGQAAGLPMPETVLDNGVFAESVPEFAGTHVFKAAGPVLEVLKTENRLLASERHLHSYPHSWRSKKPIIYRATPQWFISMEMNGLRKRALKAIDATRWVPGSSKNRIRGMIEARPDWCVSRQRSWGVPIPVFVDRANGEPLRDAEVINRVADAVEREGADAWFTRPAEEFLGPGRKAGDYEQVTDILDVWFDSGSTHAFVLEGDETQQWPADLYLEGTDQHRGWFHSSLLEACGTRGSAPFRNVFTHGFVLDDEGRKMSKSAGNVISPQEVTDKHGADVLRLWVATSDSTEDLRIGEEALRGVGDAYRRFRNTLRFILGNLQDFENKERLDPVEMPSLERWVLHRLSTLDSLRKSAFEGLAFQTFYRELHNFCTSDLSSFYLDVRKDALYCDRATSKTRRAARTILDTLHDCLTAWLAPVLCFTAEEAWLERQPEGSDTSVHLRIFPSVPDTWRDNALGAEWDAVRKIRNAITGALEIERKEKRIRSSLEAHIVVHADADTLTLLGGHNLAELSIASVAETDDATAPADAHREEGLADIAVVVRPAKGQKCARCWKILQEVGDGHPDLCIRCREAV